MTIELVCANIVGQDDKKDKEKAVVDFAAGRVLDKAGRSSSKAVKQTGDTAAKVLDVVNRTSDSN